MTGIKKDLKPKSEAFIQGQRIKAEGFSIYYNPYRDKGTGKESKDFIRGWNSI